MKLSEKQVVTENEFVNTVFSDLTNRKQQIILEFTELSSENVESLIVILKQFDAIYNFDGFSLTCIIQLSAISTFKERINDLDIQEQLQKIIQNHAVIWQAGRFNLNVSETPLIYGILNVTPDSFYDGGAYFDQEAAFKQVEKMVADGANVIEVGGQTTRPGGFAEVEPEEEIKRIAPSIKLIQEAFPQIVIAVDTYKYEVMKAVVELGVDIINDVNAFTDDNRKLELMKNSNVGLLTMHSSRDVEYHDLTEEMTKFFEQNLSDLTNAGIAVERIALDQGIGYAKVADGYQDYAMMRNLDQLNYLNRPIMVAISRKGFGAKLFNLAKEDRLSVTLIAESFMYLHGGRILRVHDVKETVQLVKMLDTINTAFWHR